MADWMECYRSIVLPRYCDHYGHMNVRYYARHFDDGGFQMWNLIGITQADLTRDGMGVVVANISIDFVREITAGQLMVIKGIWSHMGSKSMSHEMRMFNADTGDFLARQTTTEVYFDMQKRVSAPIPDHIRDKVAPNLATPEQLEAGPA